METPITRFLSHGSRLQITFLVMRKIFLVGTLGIILELAALSVLLTSFAYFFFVVVLPSHAWPCCQHGCIFGPALAMRSVVESACWTRR